MLEGVLPIGGDLLGGFAQHMTGKPLDFYPGQQQEAGILDDELQLGFSRLGVPTDPRVSLFQRSGR